MTDQEAIKQAEESGNFSAGAYQRANDHFMELHAAAHPTATSPEPLRRSKRGGHRAYLEAWGPNEYNPLGNLQEYEYTDKLSRIKIPALVIDGTDDLCTPLVAKTMYDHLPNAEWKLFQGARHMVFAEQPTAYMQTIATWLRAVDTSKQ